MEDDPQRDRERVSAGSLRAAPDPADRIGDGGVIRPNAHEDAVGDAAAHFKRARAAGGEPDGYRPVEGQESGAFGADLDLLTGEESAH